MRVEIKDIRKYFGPVKANDGITFTLETGRIYGLLGENGAGKSTLMKILSGFQGATSGEISLDGKTADYKSPAQALKAGVGMLYQDPLDFPPFSVLENFMLGMDEGFMLDLRKTRKTIQKLADQYGFETDMNVDISSLSLGERQQLELVRLLVGGAGVLILDEPTTGISGDQKDSLFSSIKRLAHEEGKTIILVSHKLEEVQELCDHVFVLRQGKLVGESEIPCDNAHLVGMMFDELPPRSDRPAVKLEQPMLELNNLSIETYRLDIFDIDLKVFSGEVFGFAGLEGSGQGLVLRACAGLIEPTQGTILVDGVDFTRYSYHKTRNHGVSFVGSGRLEEGLVAGLRLSEHMVLASKENDFWIDWSKAENETEVRIEEYQVVGTKTSTAEQLSGGNQQRFMFSMLDSPLKVVLLEQPTRGLDVRSENWIWEQLYKRRSDGTAIVFISADLDEIVERSDRIAVFSGGKMSRIVQASETNVEELGHMIGGGHE